MAYGDLNYWNTQPFWQPTAISKLNRWYDFGEIDKYCQFRDNQDPYYTTCGTKTIRMRWIMRGIELHLLSRIYIQMLKSWSVPYGRMVCHQNALSHHN